MFKKNERYPLYQVILSDLYTSNKLLIFLVLSVLATAMATVWITYQTRLLVEEKSELTIEYSLLKNEQLNLSLEEQTLSDNLRVEPLAQQLGMKVISNSSEVVIEE
ncbi:cell division protein FtsL [Mergibacter septicus]|uniref:Cell division protein FtsL n=1 Tax=Mergibacter septicus TaxID=221402 RepID=A0A8E3SCP4_9PAST|nr:cell division protein FtsL [Mergibacter septicus]AWX14517.1 cell division protein FtsL [Mergibacter septicus]AWX14989.1 cell division protein FtsL [Mergibacter septicus]QDJ12425.1 cell division protein FtsL [Mergibacter septicus]QDJ14241.1 cell division protein FtsL [Mergibacter septicus]UTU48314.1 cell division protein FtsL [Mergibacter septicus]